MTAKQRRDPDLDPVVAHLLGDQQRKERIRKAPKQEAAELRRLFGEVQSKFEQAGFAGLLTPNHSSSDVEAMAGFLSQLKNYLG